MVKGMSRHVIVVDSPDPELFEQAIFVVRKDAMNKKEITPNKLVGEACRVAQGYYQSCGQRKGRASYRRPLFWSAIGAGGIALGWILGTAV